MLKIKPKGKDAVTIAEFNSKTPLDNAKLARLMEVMIKNHLLHPSLLGYIVTGERVQFDAFTYEYEADVVKEEQGTEDADLVAEIDLEDHPNTMVFYDTNQQRLFYIVDNQIKILEENTPKVDALKRFETEYSSFNIRWNTRRSLDFVTSQEAR